ncbi:MAG: hypothetical protein ACREE9_09340 [Stellaceae bacterium]
MTARLIDMPRPLQRGELVPGGAGLRFGQRVILDGVAFLFAGVLPVRSPDAIPLARLKPLVDGARGCRFARLNRIRPSKEGRSAC